MLTKICLHVDGIQLNFKRDNCRYIFAVGQKRSAGPAVTSMAFSLGREILDASAIPIEWPNIIIINIIIMHYESSCQRSGMRLLFIQGGRKRKRRRKLVHHVQGKCAFYRPSPLPFSTHNYKMYYQKRLCSCEKLVTLQSYTKLRKTCVKFFFSFDFKLEL